MIILKANGTFSNNIKPGNFSYKFFRCYYSDNDGNFLSFYTLVWSASQRFPGQPLYMDLQNAGNANVRMDSDWNWSIKEMAGFFLLAYRLADNISWLHAKPLVALQRTFQSRQIFNIYCVRTDKKYISGISFFGNLFSVEESYVFPLPLT